MKNEQMNDKGSHKIVFLGTNMAAFVVLQQGCGDVMREHSKKRALSSTSYPGPSHYFENLRGEGPGGELPAVVGSWSKVRDCDFSAFFY